MYVHSHLRYCEAMAMLGETEAFLDGLLAVNPVAVTDRIAGPAAPAQRLFQQQRCRLSRPLRRRRALGRRQERHRSCRRLANLFERPRPATRTSSFSTSFGLRRRFGERDRRTAPAARPRTVFAFQACRQPDEAAKPSLSIPRAAPGPRQASLFVLDEALEALPVRIQRKMQGVAENPLSSWPCPM